MNNKYLIILISPGSKPISLVLLDEHIYKNYLYSLPLGEG
jgi:hypothetical protein